MSHQVKINNLHRMVVQIQGIQSTGCRSKESHSETIQSQSMVLSAQDRIDYRMEISYTIHII